MDVVPKGTEGGLCKPFLRPFVTRHPDRTTRSEGIMPRTHPPMDARIRGHTRFPERSSWATANLSTAPCDCTTSEQQASNTSDVSATISSGGTVSQRLTASGGGRLGRWGLFPIAVHHFENIAEVRGNVASEPDGKHLRREGASCIEVCGESHGGGGVGGSSMARAEEGEVFHVHERQRHLPLRHPQLRPHAALQEAPTAGSPGTGGGEGSGTHLWCINFWGQNDSSARPNPRPPSTGAAPTHPTPPPGSPN